MSQPKKLLSFTTLVLLLWSAPGLAEQPAKYETIARKKAFFAAHYEKAIAVSECESALMSTSSSVGLLLLQGMRDEFLEERPDSSYDDATWMLSEPQHFNSYLEKARVRVAPELKVDTAKRYVRKVLREFEEAHPDLVEKYITDAKTLTQRGPTQAVS